MSCREDIHHEEMQQVRGIWWGYYPLLFPFLLLLLLVGSFGFELNIYQYSSMFIPVQTDDVH